MEWKKDHFIISDDKKRLQIDRILEWLHGSYWAADRSKDIIERANEQSLCFGIFDGNRQVGFARAVTDKVVFSWLMDVIIDNDYRGKGLGKWLISCVVEHPDLKETRMGLATKDAHSLYEQFNFKNESCMRQVRS